MEVVEDLGQLENLYLTFKLIAGAGFEDMKTAESVWLKEWDSDKEFGRQTLNGMNPSCIHRWPSIFFSDGCSMSMFRIKYEMKDENGINRIHSNCININAVKIFIFLENMLL